MGPTTRILRTLSRTVAVGCTALLLLATAGPVEAQTVPSDHITVSGRIILVGGSPDPTALVISDTCTLVPDDGPPVACRLFASGEATGGIRRSRVYITSSDSVITYDQTTNAATGAGTGVGFKIDRTTGARIPITVAIQVLSGRPTSDPSVFLFTTDVRVFEAAGA